MRAGFVLIVVLFAFVTAFDGPREDLVQGLDVPGVTYAWYSGRNLHFT